MLLKEEEFLKNLETVFLSFPAYISSEYYELYGVLYLVGAIYLGYCFLIVLSYVIKKPEEVTILTSRKVFRGLLVGIVDDKLQFIPEDSDSNILISRNEVILIEFSKIKQEDLRTLNFLGDFLKRLFSMKKSLKKILDKNQTDSRGFLYFSRNIKKYSASENLYERAGAGVFVFLLFIEVLLIFLLLMGFEYYFLVIFHPLHLIFLAMLVIFFLEMEKRFENK